MTADREKLVEALLDTYDDAFDGEPNNNDERIAKYREARAALLAAMEPVGEELSVIGVIGLEADFSGCLVLLPDGYAHGDRVRVSKVTP